MHRQQTCLLELRSQSEGHSVACPPPSAPAAHPDIELLQPALSALHTLLLRLMSPQGTFASFVAAPMGASGGKQAHPGVPCQGWGLDKLIWGGGFQGFTPPQQCWCRVGMLCNPSAM